MRGEMEGMVVNEIEDDVEGQEKRERRGMRC